MVFIHRRIPFGCPVWSVSGASRSSLFSDQFRIVSERKSLLIISQLSLQRNWLKLLLAAAISRRKPQVACEVSVFTPDANSIDYLLNIRDVQYEFACTIRREI